MARENSFGTRTRFDDNTVYFRLSKLAEDGVADLDRLPLSIKVLLESLLRNENGREVSRDDIARLCSYDPTNPPEIEIPFMPARVLLQDFTGVPAVVDLAALRSAMQRLGGDPTLINPQVPVALVIDHSVQVDHFGVPEALARNAAIEFERNRERYSFLRWGQQSFDAFRVVPPASGIVHQVNLEYLADVVTARAVDGQQVLLPDSLVGTDSHTTMINGLGVVGWGVGGIEAEAVMLGQPIYMLAPAVIGFKLSGALREGTTATDLTLTVTQMLRKKGVVGCFVEFYGAGLSNLSLADRATIANMAPEYGATMGFFPLDDEALRYLRATGRDEQKVALVERYARQQGLFRTDDVPDPSFADTIELDLGTVSPSIAGPKRPQDRIRLDEAKQSWRRSLQAPIAERGFDLADADVSRTGTVNWPSGSSDELRHGDVVLAAITSCTNTSNPSVMIGAGLLARKAIAAGLSVSPTVKTSLAPGSKVVTNYLTSTGLLGDLEQLGFHVVGYGCTTCIGNSGPLPAPVAAAIEQGDLVVASVLSGNRNFEGRINPHTRANYLASPPLVVAYALAGTVDIDLQRDPIGSGSNGQPVYLRDIWPSSTEIGELLDQAADPQAFRAAYDDIERSNDAWNDIPIAGGTLYEWNPDSTYIQEPPFFMEMSPEPQPIGSIDAARVLVMVGDSVTTDHISPAGAIPPNSPAGLYLIEHGVGPKDYNSFGSRRGNDRVMTRGTFGNIRLQNQLAPGTEGGWTTHFPSGEVLSIFEAAGRYRDAGESCIVLAGDDYGMGSSRDWAAKGTFLLGVRAVIARSFERIHRSNLVGMGVLPLQFEPGQDAAALGLTGKERFTIALDDELRAGQKLEVGVVEAEGQTRSFTVTCRIDTPVEIEYYRNGGILHTVLRRLYRKG